MSQYKERMIMSFTKQYDSKRVKGKNEVPEAVLGFRRGNLLGRITGDRGMMKQADELEDTKPTTQRTLSRMWSKIRTFHKLNTVVKTNSSKKSTLEVVFCRRKMTVGWERLGKLRTRSWTSVRWRTVKEKPTKEEVCLGSGGWLEESTNIALEKKG